jgi:hypothetical protein
VSRLLKVARFLSSTETQVFVSALVALLIWAAVASGLLRNTFVPEFDIALRDLALQMSVDSRPDDAPGVLHLSFDNPALQATGLPSRVPALALESMLRVARHAGGAVVVDVDLATRDDLDEMAPLLALLREWGQDENAALLVLAHPTYSFSLLRLPMYAVLDEIVSASPNIAWGDVSAYADHDGIIRDQVFWTCHQPPDGAAPVIIPSASLYVWARHHSPHAAAARAAVETMFAGQAGLCEAGARIRFEAFGQRHRFNRSGLIEYRTTIDAMLHDAEARIRYAPDGLPRLMTLGFCDLDPAACDRPGAAPDLDYLVAERMVLVSASNDFSADDHLTPVGTMPGAVILANAGRALINTGPPRTAHWSVQLAVVGLVLLVIWSVWAVFEWLNKRAQRLRNPRLHLVADSLSNPIFVKAYSLIAADLVAFAYYYYFFVSASWNGLIAVSWGATFAMAAAELREWAERRWGSAVAVAAREESA